MRVFTVESEREIFARFFVLATPKTRLAALACLALLMFSRYCEVSLPEQLIKQFQMMLLLLRQMNISEMHPHSQFPFF